MLIFFSVQKSTKKVQKSTTSKGTKSQQCPKPMVSGKTLFPPKTLRKFFKNRFFGSKKYTRILQISVFGK